jgi:hypothetical protein
VAFLKTYNVGIIGFGFIGKVHAFAHVNLPFFFADHNLCHRRSDGKGAGLPY